MSDLTNKNPLPNTDEIHQQREARKENKLIGTVLRKPGHKMYKLHQGVLSELNDSDYFEEELKLEADFKNRLYHLVDKDGNERSSLAEIRGKSIDRSEKKHRITVKKKIRTEANTFYFSALNVKNAVKICRRMNYAVHIINV